MTDLFKNVSLYILRKMYIKGIRWSLWCLDKVTDQYKTWEMCERVVEKHPRQLEKVSDTFKTQRIYERAAEDEPCTLEAPGHLNTLEMCEKAFERNPQSLMYIPNRYKTQGMCNEVAQVPDWFVLQCHLKSLDKYKGFCINYLYDEIIKWQNGYQKRKAQKAKIKEELLPIAWHPLR